MLPASKIKFSFPLLAFLYQYNKHISQLNALNHATLVESMTSQFNVLLFSILQASC